MPSGKMLRERREHSEDEEGLEDAIRKFQRQLTCICFRYTRDWEEAKDMAQESFLKAFHGWKDFESRSQVTTWITRIAINNCLSHVVKRGRQRLCLMNYVHDRDPLGAEGRHAAREDEKSTAARVLELADPVTRKVLGMVAEQGLSHLEVAETLGVSRVAVTRRITRFRDKLLKQAETWN